LTTPDDLQAHHRFVKVCQDSNAGDARLHHVVMERNGRPVCTASLSMMRVKIDLLAGPRFRGVVHRVRRFRPRFLELPLLIAGLPVSFGQSCLRIDRSVRPAELLPLLTEVIESVAAESGASLIVAKEFSPFECADLDGLEALGYSPAASLPGCTLPVRWANFDHYLAEMRAGYRRQVKATLDQRDRRGLEIRVSAGLDGRCQEIHRLYDQVMDHAEFQLERLEPAFFECLSDVFGPDVRCITVEKEGRVLSAAVMLVGPRVAHFLIAGIDYKLNRTEGAYLNLVTEVVREAIRSKVGFIEMGQTSYEIKQRLGAMTVPRYIYLRHRDPRWHRVLSRSASRLFPERNPAPRRVFTAGPPDPRGTMP
jgi:hypothetical protein